jgi:hypothetical protein
MPAGQLKSNNRHLSFAEPQEEKPKLLKRVADAALNTAKFIYRNSYIFTNMTMMVSCGRAIKFGNR